MKRMCNDEMGTLSSIPEKVSEKMYSDAARPFMGWLGKIGGAHGHALYELMGRPVENWAKRKEEQAKRVKQVLENRIETIPADRKIEPSFDVVVPILEGLESCLDETELQDGFISLLGASMDSNLTSAFLKCHANILKQLTADEARIIKYLYSVKAAAFVVVRVEKKGTHAGLDAPLYISYLSNECKFSELFSSYMVHLSVLGLVEITLSSRLADKKIYEDLENQTKNSLKIDFENDLENDLVFKRGFFKMSPLGLDFAKACGLNTVDAK